MKRRPVLAIIILTFMVISSALIRAAQDESAADHGWPRVFKTADGTAYTVFQPQIVSWDGFTLKLYEAVSVQLPGSRQPLYGVAYLSARTLVDKEERLVHLDNQTISAAKFPSAPEKESSILKELRQTCPKHVKTISLDRLEASLAAAKGMKKADPPVRNAPPHIIFSQKPAILVYIDGDPRYLPVKNTNLSRVLNTRVLLVRDSSGKFYLHLFNGYVEAPTLSGPWSVSLKLPKDMMVVENAARSSQQVDLLEGQEDPQTNQKPALEKLQPQIFISTTPAELIVTEGPPRYVSIKGTELLYIENTSANVFKYMGDQKNYVLISGRWFRSGSIYGSWEYVPGKDLPDDFTKIPDDSPKENVRASIPGTQQAEEAVIANSIPETAKIERKSTTFTQQIDGEPQLRPINGTPLYYVINSPEPIIKVNANTWYACSNGVWFVAGSVRGPWTVAESVPDVIYSIPSSSPIYYVTFVRVYGSTADFVYDGYTPGYYGSVVSSDDIVVYGTGYHYDPWIGTYWYCPPVTYGLGSGLAWTPWGGWSFSFGFGWGWGWGPYWYYPPAPWWGPYWGWRHHVHHGIRAWGPGGWASTTCNIYRLWGKGVRVSRGAGDFEPFTGNALSRRYGMAYNSTTGTLVAGHRGSIKNVFVRRQPGATTGGAVTPFKSPAAGGGRRTPGSISGGEQTIAPPGKVIPPSRGPAAGGEGRTQGIILGGRQTPAGRVTAPPEGHMPMPGNNVFATPNGHVYLYGGGKGNREWQQIAPSQGMPRVAPEHIQTQRAVPERIAPTSSAPGYAVPEQIIPNLNRERQARSIGQQRTESFEAHRPSGESEGGQGPREFKGGKGGGSGPRGGRSQN
jgi:hypothetical protein